MKAKRRYERSLDVLTAKEENLETGANKAVGAVASEQKPTPDEIRQSEAYLKHVEEYGKAFAEALYFGIH